MQLSFVMEDDNPNTVFWIERRGSRGMANASARQYSESSSLGRSNLESSVLKERGTTEDLKGRGFSRAGSTAKIEGPSADTRRRTNVFLQATPIEVAPILREHL